MQPTAAAPNIEPSPIQGFEHPLQRRLIDVTIDQDFLAALQEVDFRTASGAPLWEQPLRDIILCTQAVFFQKADDPFAKAIRGEIGDIGTQFAFEVRQAAQAAQAAGTVAPPSEKLMELAGRLGMTGDVRPTRDVYDEAHIGGATAPAIAVRVDALIRYCEGDNALQSEINLSKIVCAGGEREVKPKGDEEKWLSSYLGVPVDEAAQDTAKYPFLKTVVRDGSSVLSISESKFTAWLIRERIAAGEAPANWSHLPISTANPTAPIPGGKITTQHVATSLAPQTPDGVSILFIGSQPYVPRMTADYYDRLNVAGVKVSFIEGVGLARQSPLTKTEILAELAKQLKADASIEGISIPVVAAEPKPHPSRVENAMKVATNFSLPITEKGQPTKELLTILEALQAQLPPDGSYDFTKPFDVFRFSQSYFDRWKTMHAADVATLTRCGPNFKSLVDLYRPLGMIDEIGAAPSMTSKVFDIAFVFGGAIPRMFDRIDRLVQVCQQGVKVKRIVLLGSDRIPNPKTDHYEGAINLARTSELFETRLGSAFDPAKLTYVNEANLLGQMLSNYRGAPREWRDVGFTSIVNAPLITDSEAPKRDPGAFRTLRQFSSTAEGVAGEYIFGQNVLCVVTQQYAPRMASEVLRCALQLGEADPRAQLPESIMTTASALDLNGTIRENDATLAQEVAKLVFNSYQIFGFPVATWKHQIAQR